MPLCQIILLADKKKLPASKHQSLDDIFIFVSSKNWCKPDDLAKWHFLLFLWYTLIFWAQKCWFIELNLILGSDAVCQKYLGINNKVFLPPINGWLFERAKTVKNNTSTARVSIVSRTNQLYQLRKKALSLSFVLEQFEEHFPGQWAKIYKMVMFERSHWY